MIDREQTKRKKYKGKLEYKGEPKTSFNLNPMEFIESSQIINKFTYSLESQSGEILYNFIADTEEEVDKKVKNAEPIMDLVEAIEWTQFKIEEEYKQTIKSYQHIRELEEKRKQLQHEFTKLMGENQFMFKVENGIRANTYTLEDIK